MLRSAAAALAARRHAHADADGGRLRASWPIKISLRRSDSRSLYVSLAVLAGALGLAASVLHLGQPLRAWRIFLGWRKSWLSREALLFGAWFPLASLRSSSVSAGCQRSSYRHALDPVHPLRYRVGTAALGVLGLFCSVMIYVDTTPRFLALRANRAALLRQRDRRSGLAGAFATPGTPRVVGVLLAAAVVIKLLRWKLARSIRPCDDRDRAAHARAQNRLLLTRRPLRSVNELRVRSGGLLGGVLLPLMIVAGSAPGDPGVAGARARRRSVNWRNATCFSAPSSRRKCRGPTRMNDALDSLLHARTGPMTDDLVLHPGDFGLGRVPARLKPAATTTIRLRLLLHRLRAQDPSQRRRRGHQPQRRPRLSGESRHGVSEGLGSAHAACARPTARPRRCCAMRAANSKPVRLGARAAACSPAKFKAIQEQHGPESVAFLSTGQIVTEEMALLGALAKFGMGMVHGDGNTRQCMATAVVAYKQSFGFDAPPFTYADFEESDVLVLHRREPLHRASDHVAARAAQSAHSPKSSSSIRARRRRRWRRRSTSRSGRRRDLMLLYGLAHLLIARGCGRSRFIDRAHDRLRRSSRSLWREFAPDARARGDRA